MLQSRRRRTPRPDQYLSNDTICALSTTTGGPVAMVRVSGASLQQHFLSLFETKDFSHGSLKRVDLRSESGGLLDQVMAVWFQAPHSFTGEEVLEIHCHGSPTVAEQVIGRLGELGIRQALPGEFSFRAVKNGKMTLAQAQGVADLIGAQNTEAAELALEKMSGTQNQLFKRVGEELRNLAAFGELGIDFADQDVDEVSLKKLRMRVGSVLEELERLKGSFSRGVRIQHGIKVALLGAPNAGKSSLFNFLLGMNRSIISNTPGTTRDTVSETLVLGDDRGSQSFVVSDTAGVRLSSDPIEQEGVERALNRGRESELGVIVIDGKDPVIPEALEGLSTSIVVLSKRDLQDPDQLESVTQKIGESLGVPTDRVVSTSSVSGEGFEKLTSLMLEVARSLTSREQGEVVLTREDHLAAVEESIEHLNRSLEAGEPDLFASDLRQSLISLSPLIGETLPDDILGKIFSEFCIGK